MWGASPGIASTRSSASSAARKRRRPTTRRRPARRRASHRRVPPRAAGRRGAARRAPGRRRAPPSTPVCTMRRGREQRRARLAQDEQAIGAAPPPAVGGVETRTDLAMAADLDARAIRRVATRGDLGAPRRRAGVRPTRFFAQRPHRPRDPRAERAQPRRRRERRLNRRPRRLAAGGGALAWCAAPASQSPKTAQVATDDDATSVGRASGDARRRVVCTISWCSACSQCRASCVFGRAGGGILDS